MNINEAVQILNNNGYTTYRLIPLNESLSINENALLDKFKNKAKNIIAKGLKLRKQKQTSDVKKQAEALRKETKGLMQSIHDSKWSKRALVALRIMTLAAGMAGALNMVPENGAIEFDTDHGQLELTNDGVQYTLDNGKAVFIYNPDTGGINMADDLNDKQLDTLSNELTLDAVDIHSDNAQNNNIKHTAQIDQDDFENDIKELDDLVNKFDKYQEIKNKLGMDDISDENMAFLSDPDTKLNDAQINKLSDEEAKLYAYSHDAYIDINTSSDEGEVYKNAAKNINAIDNSMATNGGVLDLGANIHDAHEKIVDYMKSHNHTIDPNENEAEQFMRAVISDKTTLSNAQIDNMDNDMLMQVISTISQLDIIKQAGTISSDSEIEEDQGKYTADTIKSWLSDSSDTQVAHNQSTDYDEDDDESDSENA